jgi:hypothetical protein
MIMSEPEARGSEDHDAPRGQRFSRHCLPDNFFLHGVRGVGEATDWPLDPGVAEHRFVAQADERRMNSVKDHGGVLSSTTVRRDPSRQRAGDRPGRRRHVPCRSQSICRRRSRIVVVFRMRQLKAFDEDKAIDSAVDCFWLDLPVRSRGTRRPARGRT